MSPYLNDRGLILVLKSSSHKVGDIVGFKLNDQIMIKRISRVKADLFYALGDNLGNSLDSRKLGWINQDKIVFKLILRI